MRELGNNISQICNFGQLEDGTDSVESFSHTNSSVQASPAVSTHTSRILDPSFSADSPAADITAEENRSESESMFITDYLFLSNCESGKLNNARCDTWSNSDKSLEQTSCDDVFFDSVQSQHSVNQAFFNVCLNHNNMHPANFIMVKDLESNGSSSDFSSSSPLLGPSIPQTFLLEKNHSALSDGEALPITPPPRPPKPNHFSEGRPEGISNLHNGHCFSGTVPRRISLSSLDNVRNWRGDLEDWSLRTRDKRLSLNLPRIAPIYSSFTSDSSEDSYVPMNPNASPPVSESDCSTDGYIPMSPVTASITFQAPVNSKVSSPLPELPTDLEPPPVNRDLKPRRKARPPPLDLRNLSTIREHPSVTRMWTVPYNRTSFISTDSECINSACLFSVPGDMDESYIQMEQRQGNSPINGSFPWSRKSNLDYLALDFNSASPSPVQKKPFLSEEQRVDYVQVDEKKTQALQNTKQEWTDERQSKV
ncbi:hypothetical protein GDO86_015209 [Hymenochirus boettgeri]|uniref:GRB2-associated-binding protein 3 n=1 Tax=Hymenochirus boettgeri TaxID=247094 RepID=A0A8T2JXU1_9PIPI|nr:hypothetical protein GDO86_015209 [Hymenochirus boettgeri]